MGFVTPRTERLPLSNDQWIDVKRELNAGEHRRMFARQIKDYDGGGHAKYDPEQVGFARISAYLLAWSLTRNGQPVPVSDDAIDALDQPTYLEISDALAKHEERVEAERAARKNDQDGERKLSAISPSPSDAAGALSGSVN